MNTLEALGCIAIVVFLAPYAFGAVGWTVIGILDFCEWCGDVYEKWRSAGGERCRCPRACPRHNNEAES
jgi:hypothetical protein